MPLRIVGLSYGQEIARLLDTRGGRILAVLSNALYLESYEGYVAAIVGKDAVDGPMSLRVHSVSGLLNTFQNQNGLMFTITSRIINFGNGIHITLDDAQEWTPLFPAQLGEPMAREQAAYALAKATSEQEQTDKPEQRRSEGLAALVRHCHSERSEESLSDAMCWTTRFFAALRMTKTSGYAGGEQGTLYSLVLARMTAGISQFVDSMRANDGEAAGHALTELLGLGHGLTPSGDDFVSGILAALVWQANLGTIDPFLTQGVVRQVRGATERTNRISARLLFYAGEGILYVPVMELGAALLKGESNGIARRAHQLFRIGNTSGIDLAVGLLVGCLASIVAE